MAKDKDYNRLIHTSRWLHLRRAVLNKHPTCESCAADGYVAAATEVHHVVPVEYGLSRAEKERLMFNIHNLRALCHPCHVKAHVELGRSGRAATERRADEQLQRFVKKYF